MRAKVREIQGNQRKREGRQSGRWDPSPKRTSLYHADEFGVYPKDNRESLKVLSVIAVVAFKQGTVQSTTSCINHIYILYKMTALDLVFCV